MFRTLFGMAIIAANLCVDFLRLHEVSFNLQCVWVQCDKAMFGLTEDVMLCAAYINPQSASFNKVHIADSSSSLFDELSCAAQVAPHVLLCGDLNAKVGGLNGVTHTHGALLSAHPALQYARRCECPAVIHAGRLLIAMASATNCIVSTGSLRVCGDNGQASFVGSPGQAVASRIDHIALSSALYAMACSVDIPPC